MAEPREFLVLKNLKESLENISIDNGYHNDIAALALKLDGDHDVESRIGGQPARPFVIFQVSPDVFVYDEAPNRVRVSLPFTIHVISDSDLTEDEAILQTYFRLAADVERAIAVDISRDEKAINTKILSRRIREISGAEVWGMIEGEILIRREYGEPDG